MASSKYDYSEEMPQPGSVTDGNERARRLEQRNNSIAAELRNLKPEITRAYTQMCVIAEKSDAFSKSASELLESLKVSFPIRLPEKDRMELQSELDGIVAKAILHIRAESDKVSAEIRRDVGRISLTPATFWYIVSLLAILLTFFAVVTFANIELIRSDILTEIIWGYVAISILIIAIVTFTFYKHKT